MITALALIGLHLIEPFIELVHSSNHLDLLQDLPSLFSDLRNHKDFAKKSIQVSECAFPTLKVHFESALKKGIFLSA